MKHSAAAARSSVPDSAGPAPGGQRGAVGVGAAAVKMSKQGRRGMLHVLDAFFYSMQGLRAAWRCEIAFRMQCLLLLPLVPLAFWIAREPVELALLLGVCGLVLMAEMFNSAIETVVDRIDTAHHPLSGQAKDLGSAGVFISMMLFLVVWIPLVWARVSA